MLLLLYASIIIATKIQVSYELIVSADFQFTCQTLAGSVIERMQQLPCSVHQCWVGIAGPPGAGKSTLSAAVSSLVNEMAGYECSMVIPMDGYHYSRAQLRDIAESNPLYTYESLLARRGSPWTFDSNSLVNDLEKAKRLGRGFFPTYDRKLSDPVPNAIELKPSVRVVLVEGNYLLNFEDPRWAPLRLLFDETWFISCISTEELVTRLTKRHLETWSEEKTKVWGAGINGARMKAEANDVLNAQFIIEKTMKFADRVIMN